MAQGLTMLFSFTGGKIISDSLQTPVNFGPIEQASVTGYQNGKFNRAAERSVDPADVAKRATVSLVYELPFGRNQRGWNRLIGGWQVNTIGVMQTGIPLLVSGANNQRASRPIRRGNPPSWTTRRRRAGLTRRRSSIRVRSPSGTWAACCRTCARRARSTGT